MADKVTLDDYFGVLLTIGVDKKTFKELIATNAADLYYWNALQETARDIDFSNAFEVQRSMQHNINVTLDHKFVVDPSLNDAIKMRWLEIISQNKPQKSLKSGGVEQLEDEEDFGQRRRRGGQGPPQLIEVEEESSDDEDDSSLFEQRTRMEQERLRKQQEQGGGAAPGGFGFAANFNYEDILRNLQKALLDSNLPSEVELLVFPPLFLQHASSVAKSKRKFTFQTVKGPMQSINETISLEPFVKVFNATEDDEATELAPLDEMYERFLDTLKMELKQRAAMFKMPRIKIFDFKRTSLTPADAPPPLTPDEVFGSPIKKGGFGLNAATAADKKKTAQKANDLIYLDKLLLTDVKFEEADLSRIQKKPKTGDQVEVQVQSWVHARFSKYVKEKLERRGNTGVIVILPMDAQIEDSAFEQLTESLFSLSYYDEVTKGFTAESPASVKLGLGECNLLSIVPISTFFVDIPNSISSADPKKLTKVDYEQIHSTTIPRKLKVVLSENIQKVNLWSDKKVLKIAKPALMSTTVSDTSSLPVVAVSKSALKNGLSFTVLLQKLAVDGITDADSLYQNDLYHASVVLDQSWNAVAKAIADGYAKQADVIPQVKNFRMTVETTQKKMREDQKKLEDIQKQKEEQDRKKKAEEVAEEERQRAKKAVEEEELKKKGKAEEETPEEAEQRRRKQEQDEIDKLNATFSSSKSKQRSLTSAASETLISFSDSTSSAAPPPLAIGRSTATTITPVSNNNNNNNNNSKFGDSSVIQRLSDF